MVKNEGNRLTNFLRDKATEAERAKRYRRNHFVGMLETDGGYLTVITLTFDPALVTRAEKD